MEKQQKYYSFDVCFCMANLQGEQRFVYMDSEWGIFHNRKGLLVKSDDWGRLAPPSTIFQKIDDNDENRLKLNPICVDFFNKNAIEADISYKVMSTMAIPYEYKLLLFALVKLGRAGLNKTMRRIKRNAPAEIFDKIVKHIELYETSPLIRTHRFNKELDRLTDKERFKNDLIRREKANIQLLETIRKGAHI